MSRAPLGTRLTSPVPAAAVGTCNVANNLNSKYRSKMLCTDPPTPYELHELGGRTIKIKRAAACTELRK